MTNDSDDFDEKMKRSRIALEVSFRELDARLFAIEFHIRQLLGESDPATRDRIVADTKEFALKNLTDSPEGTEQGARESRAVLRLLHGFSPEASEGSPQSE